MCLNVYTELSLTLPNKVYKTTKINVENLITELTYDFAEHVCTIFLIPKQSVITSQKMFLCLFRVAMNQLKTNSDYTVKIIHTV